MDPVAIAVLYLCLLFALCVHEAAHAAMANYCGDDTAKLQGRLTLNPLAHIDLMGTVLLPILMLSTGAGFLFGWAKPVPFNPMNLKNLRRDPMLIALAGPASNLLQALFFIFVGRVVFLVFGFEAVPELFVRLILSLIQINLILMLFNCIPVPPLDGHYVLNYFLPPEGQRVLQRIGPFGILIAIVVAQPLFRIFRPVMEGVTGFVLGV